MIPEAKLIQITARFEYLEAKMADGSVGDDFAKLSKEYADLKPVVGKISKYQHLIAEITDAEEMLNDPDMKELAQEELPDLKAALPKTEHDLQLSLLPKDEADERSAILEIRAGAGGDEAALFAGELLCPLRVSSRRSAVYHPTGSKRPKAAVRCSNDRFRLTTLQVIGPDARQDVRLSCNYHQSAAPL